MANIQWARLPFVFAAESRSAKAARILPHGIAALLGVLFFPGLSAGQSFHFSDVSSSAGIVHQFDQDPSLFGPSWDPANPEFANMTGGAVAEDFDGDGWIDLFVLRGGLSPNLLYMNQGDGTFENQAILRGADQTGRHAAVCAADYDSDGDVDLFIAAAGEPHLLLTNDGSGHFTVDVAPIPTLNARTTSPSWADVDRDGLLDLAVGSWSGDADSEFYIYRNQGEGEFRLFQIIPSIYGFVPHFADLNGDGNVDLVTVADFGGTRIHHNNGRGVFLPAGGSDIANGMGVATGDLDHDGDLDLFLTAIQHRNPELNTTETDGNRLMLNNGHGEFTDITTEAGVRAGYWGWGAVFADLENDGDEDLYHVNGFTTFWDLSGPLITTPSVLFRNDGALSFTEVGAISGAAADSGQGRCVVSFDYDNDGDLDLFVVNNNEVRPGETDGQVVTTPGRLVLLRNDTPASGHWLKVRIDGRLPYHAHGMGTRIYAALSSRTMLREINASSNFGGHGPYRIAHFGAGTATQFDSVSARFPNGDTVAITNVPADQEIVLTSPQGEPASRKVSLGGAITFRMPPAAIPSGGEARWSYEGVEYGNPATVSFSEAGKQTVHVEVFTGSTRSDLVRSESFQVEVIDPSAITPSVARRWNETALAAIRMDFPDPAVHARNLFHLSVAMWDAWAAYDPLAVGYLHREFFQSEQSDAARREAMSYAAYRLLSSRYTNSLNASASQLLLDFLMEDLGYPISVSEVEGNTPAALGNRIAATIIAWGASDGALEGDNYRDTEYQPTNPPLVLAESGTNLRDPNRWQPLRFESALTQNGLLTFLTQVYVGSHWGGVRPFALQRSSTTYLDPGPPPRYQGPSRSDYLNGALEVVRFSRRLDPDDGVEIDISPRSRGLNSLGANDGKGHGSESNPVTGLPYAAQRVKRADYGRAVAEYWADGPDSETPPGHWNKLANQVSSHPGLSRRFRGRGEVLNQLEWDVKLYFALNAALHDAAVAAWGCKRFYDYIRPISTIRYLSGLGELPEEPGLVEKITSASSAPGERHAHLVAAGASLGDTAIYAWGGEPNDPATEYTGNEWILGEDWLPYQRDTFVTPAFAGYVSGHSAFSRAAAEILADFTGDPYFPGGMGQHHVAAGSLEFEAGPSSDLTLQWATYFDAADEAGLSRLYGGIHFPVDDGPGRIMGSTAGIQAMTLAAKYFDGSILAYPIEAKIARGPGGLEIRARLVRGFPFQLQESADLWTWHNRTSLQPALESELTIPIEADAPTRFYRIIQEAHR